MKWLKTVQRWRAFQTVRAYGGLQASNYAGSVALSGFLAMFPLILGMLAVVGALVNNAAFRNKIYNGIVSVFPADAHAQVVAALNGVHHAAGLFAILSFVGL